MGHPTRLELINHYTTEGTLTLICVYIYIYIDTHTHTHTTPLSWAGCDTRSRFKQSLTGLNSEISFSKTCCHTKIKEPSFLYFPITEGRIVGFMPFPRVLVLCKMQRVRFRIWTQVTTSTSSDNCYTMNTYDKYHVYTFDIFWTPFIFIYTIFFNWVGGGACLWLFLSDKRLNKQT